MKVRDIRRRAKGKYISNGGFRFLRLSQIKRCRTYEQGCFLCDHWHFYDTHKRFPTWHELMNMSEDARVERILKEEQ
jgi:hypothetical protein